MKIRLKMNETTNRLLLLCIILFAFVCLEPSVLTATNVVSMINDSVFNGIAALGMMVIMVTGNFDLSSMSIAMIASLVTLKFYQLIGYEGDFITMFLIAGAVGAFFAMMNGFIAKKFNLSGFVVSIGTNLIFGSFFFIFMKSTYIKEAAMPAKLLKVRTATVFSLKTTAATTANVNIGIVVLILVSVLLWILLNRTQIGRGIYALGGDPAAVERVGYHPMKITLLAYAVFGMCVGVAGIYFYSNSGTFEPALIADKGSDVIASAIFGGCNMKDGKGTVGGILAGVAIITAIKGNLILLGVPSYFITFVVGTMILLGVLFSTLGEKK